MNSFPKMMKRGGVRDGAAPEQPTSSFASEPAQIATTAAEQTGIAPVKTKKRRRKKRVLPEARTRRCGECEACTRSNCGQCTCCRDMKCYGGRNVIRQCCGERLCTVYPNYNHPLSKGTRPATVVVSCSETDTDSDTADPSCYGAYDPAQAFMNPRRVQIDAMPSDDDFPWGVTVQAALDRAAAAAELATQQPAEIDEAVDPVNEDDGDDDGKERPKALTVGNEHYLADKASNKHNWTVFVRGGDPYAADEAATDHIEKVCIPSQQLKYLANGTGAGRLYSDYTRTLLRMKYRSTQHLSR